jgi:hypothetical protein
VADTKLSKFEIAASAFGGFAMTNERARDLRLFGAYIEQLGICPFFIDSAKKRRIYNIDYFPWKWQYSNKTYDARWTKGSEGAVGGSF